LTEGARHRKAPAWRALPLRPDSRPARFGLPPPFWVCTYGVCCFRWWDGPEVARPTPARTFLRCWGFYCCRCCAPGSRCGATGARWTLFGRPVGGCGVSRSRRGGSWFCWFRVCSESDSARRQGANGGIRRRAFRGILLEGVLQEGRAGLQTAGTLRFPGTLGSRRRIRGFGYRTPFRVRRIAQTRQIAVKVCIPLARCSSFIESNHPEKREGSGHLRLRPPGGWARMSADLRFLDLQWRNTCDSAPYRRF